MGNIIGVDLKLDEKYIEGAVQDVVRAGIVSALGDPAKLVKAALDQTINQKVDERDGTPTRSSYGGIPYLDYLARQTITSVVREMLAEYVSEHRDEIKKHMVEIFDQKKFNEVSAGAFIKSMIDNIEKWPWMMPITISLEKPKE